MYHNRMSVPEQPVTIVLRNKHGRREQIQYRTAERAALGIKNNDITEEDNILMVSEGNVCLYSRLATPEPLTPQALIAFFRWEVIS